jgi:site-specific DNA recombinase
VKIAAIYSRKSKTTEKGESIENQLQLCEDYARSIGINQFVIYEDEGFSGKNTERPQFKKMLKDAKLKKFDVMICYRLDRISRNVSDFSATIEELNKLNISFISISEKFDTSTPMGRAMMYIASVFAQLERETIAERIKDNMLELAKTGRWLGGTPPLGYKSEPVTYHNQSGKDKKMFKLVEVPEEMDVVKLIYDMFMEKKSFHAVARHLCENHYKGKNKGEFSRSTVEQIIRNPVYAISSEELFNYFTQQGSSICGNPDNIHGIMTYNKRKGGKKENPVCDWIIAIGKHKGIIPAEKWLKSQEIISELKSKASPREGTSSRSLLSGMFICGLCGSGMGITSKTTSSKSGKVERYYRCNLKNRSASRCPNRNINGEFVDQIVVDYLKNIDKKSIIENYNEIQKELKQSDEITKEINQLNNQLELNNKTIQGLIRKMALLDDDMVDMIKKEIDVIKFENEDLSLKIKEYILEIDKSQEMKYSVDEILDKLDNFNKFIDIVEDVDSKRKLINSVVEHVIWNSENETLEINLIGSNKSVPRGIVNRRLRFGTGSR